MRRRRRAPGARQSARLQGLTSMSDPMRSDGAHTGFPPSPPTNQREAAAAPLTMMEFAGRVLLAVLIVALAYLAWRGAHVLLLTFAGILLAVFLSGVSDWL